MGKKHKHLYGEIIREDTLQRAYHRASSGKKSSHGYLVFKEFAQTHIFALHQSLLDESWQPKPYRDFVIYEPKRRSISAPMFSDRIVHHALISVIEPIFDRTFLPYSFACRAGKGTHAGVRFVQSQLRKHNYPYFLKTDFKAFFPSIDRAILHREFERKISCKSTLLLLRKIIPVSGVGVPIGALTSQLSANVYGNILDQYLHHVLKVPFARYMDDVIVLGHDIQELRRVKDQIELFASQYMKLEISRWQIASTRRGINFLGYRIWAKHKLLRRSSVIRAKQRIRSYTQSNDWEKLYRFVNAWKGHASKADSANLKRYLDEHYNLRQGLLSFQRKPKVSRETMLIDLLN